MENNHAHETHGFTTHTIRWNGSIDESLFSNLLDEWIESPDLNLLRLKGTVRINDSDGCMVVQGVRKQVTFDYDDSDWPEDNALVVIGKDISSTTVERLRDRIFLLQSDNRTEAETCQR